MKKNLKTAVRRLTARELEELRRFIAKLLEVGEAVEVKEKKPSRRRHVKHAPSVTYQRERVRCGKSGCKCADGELHGPYWYAYFWDQKAGKVRSKYLGKRLPGMAG